MIETADSDFKAATSSFCFLGGPCGQQWKETPPSPLTNILSRIVCAFFFFVKRVKKKEAKYL